MEQLWGAIGAVFASWNGKRAISYRRFESIPDDWGTAVNIQSMVFGNMGTLQQQVLPLQEIQQPVKIILR